MLLMYQGKKKARWAFSPTELRRMRLKKAIIYMLTGQPLPTLTMVLPFLFLCQCSCVMYMLYVQLIFICELSFHISCIYLIPHVQHNLVYWSFVNWSNDCFPNQYVKERFSTKSSFFIFFSITWVILLDHLLDQSTESRRRTLGSWRFKH